MRAFPCAVAAFLSLGLVVGACSSSESSTSSTSTSTSTGGSGSTPATNCQSRCEAKGSQCGSPAADATTRCQSACQSATEADLKCIEDASCTALAKSDGKCPTGSSSSSSGSGSSSSSSGGPGCKIGGEWEASIAQGFVNKAHAGFFGHGILGEWVNLGAMTTNSDLKNNYGTVRVNRAGAETETGLIKVGSFIADHCKTGIGTLIPTGATWGVGVNYFGGDLSPKHMPPFVWGAQGKLVEHKLDKMIATANAAMKRRSAALKSLGRRDQLSDAEIALIGQVFGQSSKARADFLR